jgi:hypothetical protein
MKAKNEIDKEVVKEMDIEVELRKRESLVKKKSGEP